jgi:hypothetical protein
MNIRVWYLFVLAVCLSLAGCGYREGVVQPSPKSYLLFSGNTADAVAYIGDLKPFRIKGPYERDPAADENRPRSETTLYQLQPGKYNIVVKKGDNVVVNRVIILGEGMTTEIEVP